jgi:hypothetical protein
MLAVAANLRVLKLHFSPFTFAGEQAEYQQKILDPREIYLMNVMGDRIFPFLRAGNQLMWRDLNAISKRCCYDTRTLYAVSPFHV